MNERIPKDYPGYGTISPYTGLGKDHIDDNSLPTEDPINEALSRKGRIPKEYQDLREVIASSGLADGMRISFHHHLRLGDRVLGMVLLELGKMGFRDLKLCVSSVMGPPCEAVLDAVRDGVISMIETTGLKAPLTGELVSGKLGIPVVIRSHGGRARAIMADEITIDVAFIAASAVDSEGNASGAVGPNRFGSIGYALPDALKAGFVVIITDHREESIPVSIPSSSVDALLTVASIGDKAGIAGGSIRRTKRPVEQLIAKKAMEIIQASGLVNEGFSFQAGSGGISLEVSMLLKDYLRQQQVTAAFASGGITEPLVTMMEDGLIGKLYDVQSFDDTAAASLAKHDDHIEMSAALYADPNNPDCIAKRLDIMVLSATEVDRAFNINSITGTDGRILGALGGAPDTASGSQLTIVVIPSFRGRIPTVCEQVRTICTPGTTVDVVVTERGICVNPSRVDLIERFGECGISLTTMDELITAVHRITGQPTAIPYDHEVKALVEYHDGTIIDLL